MSDVTRYSVEIEHHATGRVDARFCDVARDNDSRRRVAAALRIIADRVDPDCESWDTQEAKP